MSDTASELRPNRRTTLIVGFSWLAAALVPIVALLESFSRNPASTTGEGWKVGAVSLGLLGIAAVGISGLWVQISTQISEDMIVQRRLLGKPRMIRWSDATSAGRLGWVIVIQDENTEIRFLPLLFEEPSSIDGRVRKHFETRRCRPSL